MTSSTSRPVNRRHSYSAFTIKDHQHIPIPNTTTSHPDDPIPHEPAKPRVPTMSSVKSSLTTAASSPRSSGENLGLFASDDSDTPSTPLTEPHDAAVEEVRDKIESLPTPTQTSDANRPPSPAVTRKRRASTTYAANSEDIRRILGNGSGGTKFLQKYCCGEGCCMVEGFMPSQAELDSTSPVHPPKNDAFTYLNPKLGALNLDTRLTNIVELPQPKVSLGGLRKQSISENFPDEQRHEHSKEAVNTFAPHYMQPHPPYNIFSAPLYGARQLTKPGAEKRTFHFDIDVTDYPEEGGVDFKVGGAVGICPPNDPDVVEDIMDTLGLPRFQRDKPVRLHTNGGRWPTIWGEEEARELVTTRRELLTWTVDISSAAPTKPLLRVLAEHAQDPSEKKILLYLCSAQGQAAFCDLRTGPHITLQQLLHAFPSSKPPLHNLLSVLTQLMPRFYSLSNDPHISSAREGLANRRLIEMAVTIHETPSFTGNQRSGVGSGYLERLALQFIAAENAAEQASPDTHIPGVAGRSLDLQIPMFRGLMANPLSKEFVSDGPMMLIGAGVGMAPFRGFILNRLKNANCANKIWLVQGVRDSLLDEIYSGELGEHEKDIKKVVQSRAHAPPPAVSDDTKNLDPASGAVDLTTSDVSPAASNERKVAKYVQDEVRLQADIVWFVINALDGRIFVCGSTKGMGEGVERALVDVAMDKGGLDFETAKEFWEGKKGAGQYIAETW
ncbi:hypothetical protein MBLNU230_g3146t1 [Neophaeotheca triangularis]